jgi:DNA-binding SARP family transcriptional activator
MQTQPDVAVLTHNDSALPKLRIYTLGTLQVVRDNHAVTEGDWHTRQARQLLKILITERPRPISTDRLIEMLWPNSTPSAAATTLRSAINALRNVLEPTRRNRAPSLSIVTEAPGYAFRIHPDIWLDIEVFDQTLNQAEAIQDSVQRQPLLEMAVELYRDDYLISDPYADWATNERERLRERYFTALLQLAEIQAGLGAYSAAIAACRRILAREEVRENAYQALMRYQAESGDSAGALMTYERCRVVLAEELGADPSPLTQQWHQRILNGEVEPRLVTPSAALHRRTDHVLSPGLIADLPQQTVLPAFEADFPETLVGRETESSQLAMRLAEALAGRGNLALLEGEAGVGKTRLAYALLQQAVVASATVISTACQPLERQLPFAPLADSLGRYIAGLPDVALQSLPAASLAQLIQIVPSLQDRLPGAPAASIELSPNTEESRQRLIEGIVAFLAALAKKRPLVFFIDDLHWADSDTLAVLSRLSQRLADLPLCLLLAYRSDDLAENAALATLIHTFKRAPRHRFISVQRLVLSHVEQFVYEVTGKQDPASQSLAAYIYSITQGNALFVTEALRDWQERQPSLGESLGPGKETVDTPALQLVLSPTQRVQEVILERIERLPDAAQRVLQLSAVIGRDFSLELLERSAVDDPIAGLELLLQRKFLVERPDERLEFSHQIVRQVAYERMAILQRRRLHQRVANALVALERAGQNPLEIAFHYGQAGANSRQDFAHFSLLAGEMLLRTYGFRQAVDTFDQALLIFETMPDGSSDQLARALQGRGLAFESLFDPDGVTETYRRLQAWARRWGDQQLMLTAYSRLTSMLGLLGQQRESNELLRSLMEMLDAAAPVRSQVMHDLYERRRLLYSLDQDDDAHQVGRGPSGWRHHKWAPYTPPPPPVSDPVGDILRSLDRVHAVLPLFDYGWILLVQGQLGEATRCLEAVVDLAKETAQPYIASTAYYQLAVTARLLGELEQSHALNEQSVAINRAIQGTAAELGSMWPRIGSAFLSLKQGRLEEAERRLHRVVALLGEGDAYRNHRNSAMIGLGLAALARGDPDRAHHLLTGALADPANLYPYTHVHALIGLARIAHQQNDMDTTATLLRRALRFAGRRSLLEEYMDCVQAIAELRPAGAPIEELLGNNFSINITTKLTDAASMI